MWLHTKTILKIFHKQMPDTWLAQDCKSGCTQAGVCEGPRTTIPYQLSYANNKTWFRFLCLIHKTWSFCFSDSTETVYNTWGFATRKERDLLAQTLFVYLFVVLSIKELSGSLHMSSSLNFQYKGATLPSKVCQVIMSISAPSCGHRLLQV